MAPIVPPATYTGFDIFSRRRQANIATDLTFKSASNFSELSVISPVQLFPPSILVTDTLEVRRAGSTTVVAQFNGFIPVRKRVYTFVIRGVTSITTAPRSVAISGYLNR
jgi:hypothetical protein